LRYCHAVANSRATIAANPFCIPAATTRHDLQKQACKAYHSAAFSFCLMAMPS
jgi:hypothetical protein